MSKKARVLFLIAGLLAVVAVAAAIASGVRYWGMSAVENARSEAVTAANEYTVTMFARDPKSVSDQVNETMEFLVGSARDEFQKNIVDHDIPRLIKDQNIVTAVTIQGSGVMSNTRDTAKVLVYLNLSSTKNAVEDVQIDQSRIVYDMVKRDGRWLISAMDILDDESLKSRVEKADAPPSGAVPIPGSSTQVPPASPTASTSAVPTP